MQSNANSCTLSCSVAHVAKVHMLSQNKPPSMGVFRAQCNVQTYYRNRSQPPLFGAMLELLLELPAEVHDSNGLNDSFWSGCATALQQELQWWASPFHTIIVKAGGQRHRLARYCAAWDQPRPESYKCAHLCVCNFCNTSVRHKEQLCSIACEHALRLPRTSTSTKYP